MGSFFTNLHVSSGDAPPAALIPELSSAIDAAMERAGLRRCAVGDTKTRELVLIPSGRWLAVFDSGSEDQGGEHSQLASALSRAMQRPAAAFMVHDSDVFQAELFVGGELADRYVNRPDYFEDVGEEASEAVAGEPEAWRDVAGADTRRIGAVFAANDEVFCEEQTAALAGALGMDVKLATRGYNYVGELELRDGEIRLAYCESNPTPKVVGPPRLEVSDNTRLLLKQLASGKQLASAGVITASTPLWTGGASAFSLEFENRGGAHRGVRISLGGAGVSNALVEITGASLQADRGYHELGLSAQQHVVELPEVTVHEAGYHDPDQPLGRHFAERPALMIDLRFFVEGPTSIPLSLTVEPIGAPEGAGTVDFVLSAQEWAPSEGHLRQRFTWPQTPPPLDAVIDEVRRRGAPGLLPPEPEHRLLEEEVQFAPDVTLLRVRDLIVADIPHSQRAEQSGAIRSIREVLVALGGEAGPEERGKAGGSPLEQAAELLRAAQQLTSQLSDSQKAQAGSVLSALGLAGPMGDAMAGVMESLGLATAAAPKPVVKAKPVARAKAKPVAKAKQKAKKPKTLKAGSKKPKAKAKKPAARRKKR